MELLIAVLLLVSAVVAWRIEGFWKAIVLSASMSFVIWVQLNVLATHPLVRWKVFFVPASLGVSITCFFVVFGCGALIRYFKR